MIAKAPPASLSVFINCPFDGQYLKIFHALVFAVHDAGFYSRCALEVLDTGEVRLGKISRIIEECGNGIHDLSRVEVTRTKLPRFNMPFEAGLFFGMKFAGSKQQKDKRILVLDSEPYRYMKVLSDIAGQDAQSHHNDPEKAIEKVRTWLKTNYPSSPIPGGRAICKRYGRFRRELPRILRAAHVGVREINQLEFYCDYREFVIAWLKRHPI